MQELITKTECEHCAQVKEIFQDLSDCSGTDGLCIVDAYPFGYVVLEWFYPEKGFDSQAYFTSASDLFDYVLDVWENRYIHKMKEKYGDTDLDDDEILAIMTQEDADQMKQIKNNYIMQYESCAICW